MKNREKLNPIGCRWDLLNTRIEGNWNTNNQKITEYFWEGRGKNDHKIKNS